MGDWSCSDRKKVKEGALVACGRCSGCMTRLKSQWIGRGISEAVDPGDPVLGLWHCTLTFRPAAGFDPDAAIEYEPVQLWLKRFREWARRFDARLRYLVCAERGPKGGRPHFHCLLYWRGAVPPLPEESYWPNGQPKKRFEWTGAGSWREGNCNIRPIDMRDLDEVGKSVSYVVSYAMKGYGRGRTKGDNRDSEGQPIRDCRRTCSLGFGAGYAVDFAEKCAQAGLPFDGSYTIPGVRFDRGSQKGRHFIYTMGGGQLQRAIEAYNLALACRFEGGPVPRFVGLSGFAAEAEKADPVEKLSFAVQQLEARAREAQRRKVRLVPDHEPDKAADPIGYLALRSFDRRAVLMVTLDRWGLVNYEGPDVSGSWLIGDLFDRSEGGGNLLPLAFAHNDAQLRGWLWVKWAEWVAGEESRMTKAALRSWPDPWAESWLAARGIPPPAPEGESESPADHDFRVRQGLTKAQVADANAKEAARLASGKLSKLDLEWLAMDSRRQRRARLRAFA